MDYSQQNSESNSSGSIDFDNTIILEEKKFPIDLSEEQEKFYNAKKVMYLGIVCNDKRDNTKKMFEEIFKNREEFEIDMLITEQDLRLTMDSVSNNIVNKTCNVEVYDDVDAYDDQKYASKKINFGVLSLYSHKDLRIFFINLLNEKKKQRKEPEFRLRFKITKEGYYKYMAGSFTTLTTIKKIIE